MLIKDLFHDNFNQIVIDAIKTVILERLWLLVLSMKDKTSVGDCGTVLNKSAGGEEYKWGLRFYILLTECFRGWAGLTDDPELHQKYNRIREVVPLLEEDVYYFQALEEHPLDHYKSDELLVEHLASSPGFRSPTNKTGPAIPSKTLEELSQLKSLYLKELFSKNANSQAIVENQMMYVSFFDSVKNQFFNAPFNSPAAHEAKFAQIISELPLSGDMDTAKGIDRLRLKVCDIMEKVYGECPLEYRNMLEHNARKSPVTSMAKKRAHQTDNYDQHDDMNNFRRNHDIADPVLNVISPIDTSNNKNYSPNGVKGQVSNNAGYGSDERLYQQNYDADGQIGSNPIFQSNMRLKDKKEALLREIETLRSKEKSFVDVSRRKTEPREMQKIDANPEVLIEEIQRKARDYDVLKNKYTTLINQMDRKMKTGVEKSILGENYSRVTFDKRNFDMSVHRESTYSQARASNYFKPGESSYLRPNDSAYFRQSDVYSPFKY